MLTNKEPEEECFDEPDGENTFDTPQAAKLLGITVGYMRQLRSAKAGPAYYKVKTGRGQFQQKVLYKRKDLIEWKNRRTA